MILINDISPYTIVIRPKKEFDEMCDASFACDANIENIFADSAFVSINDSNESLRYYGVERDYPYFKLPHTNTINLYFDDIGTDYKLEGYKLKEFDENQAQDLIDFFERNKKQGVTRLFIHCTAGRSRSVAVAMFLWQTYCKGWKIDTPNAFDTPNYHVLATLKKIYNKMVEKNKITNNL